MLPVFPVYPHSLCISKSTHAGCLPGPAYPYFDNNSSTEVHTVKWIPGPWVKQTGSVLGDSNVMMLSGHDTGMMIPHLSPIMDNLMLPLTLVGSSCSWPFSSFKVNSKGAGLVGFFPAYAPYIYCDAPAADKPSSDALKAKKPPSAPGGLGDKVIQAKGKFAAGAKAKAAKLPGRAKLKALGEKTGFSMSVSGRGRIYIPTCKTVMMRMSLAEILLGWAKVLVAKAFDALVGAALKHLKLGHSLRPARLDSDAARRLAMREFSAGQARVLSKAAQRELLETFAVNLAWKCGYEGVVKSVILDGKLKLPYGLFSMSLSSSKGTFLWWGELEGPPTPIDFKGFRGETMEALNGVVYQPEVDDMLADNPNHATAPGAAAP